MTNKKLSDEEVQSYRLFYQELCNSYRAIDDFRAKLLGLLPLATGTGIFILVLDDSKLGFDKSNLSYIGLFGFFITLGLLFYELYGIKKCTSLIKEGARIEKELGHDLGQFSSRPPGVLGLINEPSAASIIYPAVLAAWAYVGYFDEYNPGCAKSIACWVFALGFLAVFCYDIYLSWDSIKEYWNKHFGNK